MCTCLCVEIDILQHYFMEMPAQKTTWINEDLNLIEQLDFWFQTHTIHEWYINVYCIYQHLPEPFI